MFSCKSLWRWRWHCCNVRKKEEVKVKQEKREKGVTVVKNRTKITKCQQQQLV